MKYSLLLLVCLAGCDTVVISQPEHKLRYSTVQPEVPAMNLPVSMRMHNWGGGSCEYASLCSHLEWLGYPQAAEYIRANYSGGANITGGGHNLDQLLDKLGFTYAVTTTADPGFLDWATVNRLGAVIEYKPNHCINFVGHHGDFAYLLDNNHTGMFETVPWPQFLKSWQRYGGNALSIIAIPPPPVPNYPIR